MKRNESFLFASLQGQTASEMLPANLIQQKASIVLFSSGKIELESTAAIKVLSRLGGPWKIVLIFLWLPRFFRDPIYRLIARNRYFLFGRRESCRMPSRDEKARFRD